VIAVPEGAADVRRYVARVFEVVRGALVLNLWCACPASLADLVAHAAANGGCVNDPASGEPDIFASVDPRQRGVTVRGDVAFAGAAVEVVTYSHGGEERAVVASSPAVVTEGRR
jgi:hypothetical protein